MSKRSAGLLMFRRSVGEELEFLLVHPGGPFWRNKDDGAWSIPKGEIGEGEEPMDAAQREFEEETGVKPRGPFIALTPVTQKAGKTIYAWAFCGDCDPTAVRSNTFTMEWPPKSGKRVAFPEVDRAAFFDAETAKVKLNPGQAPLVDDLKRVLTAGEH